MAAQPDQGLLAEMLREVERVVDHQVRWMKHQDDKTEQTLALATATLGGGLVLATFLHQTRASDIASLVLVASASSANLASLWRLLRAYLGVPKLLRLGPHPGWIAEKSNDATWSKADHYLFLLAGFPRYYEQNAEMLARVARERLAGLRLLLVALLGYSSAAAYMLWKGVIL